MSVLLRPIAVTDAWLRPDDNLVRIANVMGANMKF